MILLFVMQSGPLRVADPKKDASQESVHGLSLSPNEGKQPAVLYGIMSEIEGICIYRVRTEGHRECVLINGSGPEHLFVSDLSDQGE